MNIADEVERTKNLNAVWITVELQIMLSNDLAKKKHLYLEKEGAKK